MNYQASIRRLVEAEPLLPVDVIARRIGCHYRTVYRHLVVLRKQGVMNRWDALEERVRLILSFDPHRSSASISRELGIHRQTVTRYRARFLESRRPSTPC